MDQYFLYRHIRLDTNKPFYVGIGKKPKSYNGYRTEYKRAFNTSHRNVYWKSIAKKAKYRVEIMMESNDLDFIKNKEVEFISLYGRKEDGGTLANLTSGGEFSHTEVYKHRKIFKHTEATRERMKNSKRNNNSGVYDLDTGRQFRSFVEACEELGLDFHKEYDRCRYKSKLARIFKLNTLPQND